MSMTKTKYLIIILTVFLFFFICSKNGLAQSKQPSQSIKLTISAIKDDQFPIIGKGLDIAYEKRMYNNFFIKGGVMFSNSQRIRGGRNVAFSIRHDQADNSYSNYFIGQERQPFEDMNSFIVNRLLLEIGIAYKIGKRNQLIPEVGLSTGSGYKTSLGVYGTTHSQTDGRIIEANSFTNFIRTELTGYFVGVSYAILLKNNFYIQPNIRFLSVLNRSGVRNNLGGGADLMGSSFGISFRKDF